VETAVIGIIGAVIGIILTNASRIVLDVLARRERVRDVQTSLRAEIRSHRSALEIYLDEERWSSVAARIRSEPDYSPFVPREIDPFVFDAILPEIHVLPGEVIDPLVLCYRQWRALAAAADDMRGDAFAKLSQDRKAALYEDYVRLGSYGVELDKDAIDAINRSLKHEEEA
jgi:hypothetical protein